MTQRKGAKVPTAVGTGLLALDVVLSSDEFEPVGRWAGGTFGNVMAILAFFGWKSIPVSRLRQNDDAAEIRRDLTAWKVQTTFIRTDLKATTPVVIQYIRRSETGDATHRFSLRCPVCGKHLPAYRPLTGQDARALTDELPQPEVFFFDRVSRGALDLAQWSREKGALVFFEPSATGDAQQMKRATALAHVLKYSQERFGDDSSLADAQGPLLIVETLGARGLRFKSRLPKAPQPEWEARRPFGVARVLDAAGAGDWCTAGLIARLADKGLAGFRTTSADELDAAIAYGQALAAWNCGFEGARGGMYHQSPKSVREQVQSILSGRDKKIAGKLRAISDARDGNHHLCASCR